MRTRAAITLAALALTGAAAGCSSTGPTAQAEPTAAGAPATADASAAPGAASAQLAKQQGRTAIDVRTPSEYASGHVDGARNIDIQGAGFASQVAGLDPAGTYVVYCRSGNRSAAAADQMRAAGLDVLDGGAFTTMVDAGWPAA